MLTKKKTLAIIVLFFILVLVVYNKNEPSLNPQDIQISAHLVRNPGYDSIHYPLLLKIFLKQNTSKMMSIKKIHKATYDIYPILYGAYVFSPPTDLGSSKEWSFGSNGITAIKLSEYMEKEGQSLSSEKIMNNYLGFTYEGMNSTAAISLPVQGALDRSKPQMAYIVYVENFLFGIQRSWIVKTQIEVR